MVNYTKSQPPPTSLATEKAKGKSGKYNESDVLERLEIDFYNKCYICEQKAPISINVEHLISHQGNLNLKFDWNNLFWSCVHCNLTKSTSFDSILDCTNSNHDVLNMIICRIKPYPKELVSLEKNYEEQELETALNDTIELLKRVYNGTTNHKEKEAANLRRLIQSELLDFQNNLLTYYNDMADEAIRQEARQNIKKSLKIQAPFTAFKYWIIKENAKLSQEFQDFLPV